MNRLFTAIGDWWAQKFAQAPAAAEFRPWSLERSPLLRLLLFYGWDYPFTRAGKLLIVAFFVSSLPGAITDEVPVYVVPVALLSLVLVLSAVGSVLRLARCELRVVWPSQVTAGQTMTLPVTVLNTGRLPIYDLAAACFGPPTSWDVIRDETTVAVLPRGRSATLFVRLRPGLRGQFGLPPVRVFSTFPFNLFRNEIAQSPVGTVLVLPRFHELREVRLDTAERHQPGGLAFTSQIGESPEYIGNRDYVPGDALRRIDFRSWARLARPIVREYQDEYYSRVALVLDTYVPPRRRSGRLGFVELEAAVSLTASIAEAVSRGEAIIDIFAAGPELHVFRTGRNTTPFEHILEILAGVNPSRTNPFEILAPALAEQVPHVSTVICVLLDWDAARERLCREAVEAGCYVKVILVRSHAPLSTPAGVEFLQITPHAVQTGLSAI